MSSNNAENVLDINKSDRFVKSNDYSDSTPSMNIQKNSNSSRTYYDEDVFYSIYTMVENGAIKKQVVQDEGDDMKNDEILRVYMDKVDNDQRDLKNEMRERENRIDQSIRDSENRMDSRLERIENMIADQNNKIENLSDKFDQSVKEIKSNKLQTFAIVIATIISVAGVAFAAIQVAQSFISLVH